MQTYLKKTVVPKKICIKYEKYGDGLFRCIFLESFMGDFKILIFFLISNN